MTSGNRVDKRGCSHRENRGSFWRGHIEAQGLSGLSIRGYCREHGLADGLFYQWRRRFRLEGEASAGPANGHAMFARVRVTAPMTAGVPPLSPSDGVEVVLQNGRLLRVRPGFDGETLQRAVAVLESLPC